MEKKIMPDHLCPVCKSWLYGNINDGEFCRYCGYERIGNKKLEQQKKKREKDE